MKTWFSVLGIALLCSAMALGQTVHTDYDHKANFSSLKTYYWEKVHASNSLWQQRITDAIDEELQSKGWQKVDRGQGQVALTAMGSTQNQQEYQTFYNGLGGGWRWGGFGDQATTTVQNYQVGTLVVDMFDPKDKELLWRGTASDTLSDKPEKNIKDLDKAVDKMFKDFPPK